MKLKYIGGQVIKLRDGIKTMKLKSGDIVDIDEKNIKTLLERKTFIEYKEKEKKIETKKEKKVLTSKKHVKKGGK